MSEVTLKVGNTEITVGGDHKYTIIGKPDMDAPKGFAEYDTSKYLMANIGEKHSIPYDSQLDCYDTSFDNDSASNEGVDQSLIKNYVTHIQKPYEQRFKKKLDSTNDDFWGEGGEKGFMMDLYIGKVFDMRNLKHRLELFQALKKGHICEKGEKDHFFQKAKYCIVDNNKKQNVKEKKAKDKAKAFFTFMNLLNEIEENDDLYAILEWINFPNARATDKDTLMTQVSIFFDNITTGQKNCEKFMEAYNMLDDKDKRSEMDWHSALSKLNHNKKLTYRRSQYYIGDLLLGNSLKSAANAAVQKDEKASLIKKAVQDELDTIE